jgi:predicted DCC family thiol-disulfide oxidoreductase YuxK
MSTDKIIVLYDGACKFCCKSIALLKKLDWLGKIDYADARDESGPLMQIPEIAAAPLLEQMHVWDPRTRKLRGGFPSIRWMAWRVPAMWPVAPLLYLPGMTWLGQRVYLEIARRRFQIIPCTHGECQLPKPVSRR